MNPPAPEEARALLASSRVLQLLLRETIARMQETDHTSDEKAAFGVGPASTITGKDSSRRRQDAA